MDRDALDRLLLREGPYSNDPQDPGGETAWGISKVYHPEEWKEGKPTRERALQFYSEWFRRLNLGAIPDLRLQEHLFDFCVNSGPGTAIKAIQRIVGVRPDGVLGPQTVAAIRQVPPRTLNSRLLGERIKHIATFAATHPKFMRGLVNRALEFLPL